MFFSVFSVVRFFGFLFYREHRGKILRLLRVNVFCFCMVRRFKYYLVL